MSGTTHLKQGLNDSERAVYSLLCEVFMPTNVFANSMKSDSRELCDVLVRLLDCAFLVSVRDRAFNANRDETIEWGRWARASIGDKIKSLTKGGRYLRNQANRVVYLDSTKARSLPSWIARTAPEKIHKIVVGCGIPDSISGHKVGAERTLRLQLVAEHQDDTLFTVGIVKSEGEVVHVFDIEALRLVCQFADTPMHVQHESMSRDDRTKNSAFMAHAIAGQTKCSCLAIGMLARNPLHHPAMALAVPEDSPVINRDMSSIKITIDGALRWLADLG